MSAQALQLDVPGTESGGPLPLIVAVVAALSVAYLFVEQLETIPDRLQTAASDVVRAASAESIDVLADGRDILVHGEVAAEADRASLLERLAQLEGVRIVKDDLTVIDRPARQRAARLAFVSALEAIDFSVVSFDAGRASLADDSRPALDSLADLMTRHPASRIRVAGHTDATGPAAVNLRISRERATTVARWLTDRGIAPDRIIATGYGSTQPLADNATETGRARNRRIAISYID